eukprot:TRINITY_DN4232_c0_g1_i18.p1 TRINITY_DN4232_c0_g1~~TRINITY_DN4232_c0_g1_i18.p1  ORF type:complete len:179 (+),score=50.38 TRINITY_DN4232_c0_g1_i18:113-649(+)
MKGKETTALSISKERLLQERKQWRRDHPHGFYAKPVTSEDGTVNLYKWEAGIPGKEKTLWEGGVYKLVIEFSEDYPNKPPKCKFSPVLFHPNIYPSGTVCLSILSEDEGWKPSLSLKEILLGIQYLLDHPNTSSPAQAEPYRMYMDNKSAYEDKVRLQARENNPQRKKSPLSPYLPTP